VLVIRLSGKILGRITFTGSIPIGAKVAERATAQVKKPVLELGGSDPFMKMRISRKHVMVR
jgi:acyl-CoA reductase-like NAD-dependent aldehyde dehydrogenase